MGIFETLQFLTGNQLIAPFYHAVSDQPLPHIRHLYAVKNAAQFESDLDFLLKHYTPISFSELNDWRENRSKRVGKPPFLLSFDDGLREFYDPVAPILLRKGVPAICFINSGFLDNQALFFRYKAGLLIEALQDPERAAAARAFFQQPHQAVPDNLTSWLLSIKYQDQSVLDQLAVAIGLDFNAFLQQEQPYLTAVQVESLIRQGFHIGAHSVDHPEYRFIPEDEQLRQTVRSIETISNRFGLGYRLFSFPFTDYGVRKSFFDFILEDKKAAEFTFGCAGLKTDTHARHWQRIPLEVHNLPAESILNRAFLFYLLKMPFGKNRIRRT